MSENMMTSFQQNVADSQDSDERFIPVFVNENNVDIDFNDYLCVVTLPQRHVVQSDVRQLDCSHRICGSCFDHILQDNPDNPTCPGPSEDCGSTRLDRPENVHSDHGAECDLEGATGLCIYRCGETLLYEEIPVHQCRPSVSIADLTFLTREMFQPAEIVLFGEDSQVRDEWKAVEKAGDVLNQQIISSISEKFLKKILQMNENEPLTVLILGKTGAGKSALGNTILGAKHFISTGRQTSSVTTDIETVSRKVCGRELVIVDTPGTIDTSEHSDIVRDLTAAIENNKNGYDAFLIVLRYPIRLTEEEILSLRKLKDIIGGDIGQYAIIVFTGADNFRREVRQGENEQLMFKDYIESRRWSNKKDTLGPLFRMFPAGWIFIDNFEENPEMKDRQRMELFTLVEQVRKTNGRKWQRDANKTRFLTDDYHNTRQRVHYTNQNPINCQQLDINTSNVNYILDQNAQGHIQVHSYSAMEMYPPNEMNTFTTFSIVVCTERCTDVSFPYNFLVETYFNNQLVRKHSQDLRQGDQILLYNNSVRSIETIILIRTWNTRYGNRLGYQYDNTTGTDRQNLGFEPLLLPS